MSSAPPCGVLPESLARAGDGDDLHLQMATTVMGYAIRAEDGEIGHVKDVLVDDRAWAIRYLVVDTEHWWAGKTVLVSPGWFTRVAWDESKTFFCLVTAVGDAGAAGRPVPGERAHHNAGVTQASNRDLDHVPVQMSGFVRPQTDIDKAVQVAREVAGVTSVKNDVRVT
ncbi:MAG: BON domain-containing protein [Candidatus Rokubacteria bacterium]|nr:BON domain-containing protein [Candidatus Rokubacteria bacterium]